MKCNNRMILTQVILMYLAHLPIYIGLVLLVIMLFTFCLDVIGSIILYCKYKSLE